MTPWRRRLRRARLALTVLLSGLIIAAAVVVGIAQLLLPQVALHPDRVAAFLSERLQRPVSVDSVAGAWEGTGAVLSLQGVHIAASDPRVAPIVIGQAQLVLDFTAWAHANRRWNEFRLSGLDLDLQRRTDGSWDISGMAGAAPAGDGPNPLLMLGALVLNDTRVRIRDAAEQIDLRVHANELRLLNWGSEHRVMAVMRRDDASLAPLRVVARFDEETRDGELYVDSIRANLAGLLDGLGWHGARIAKGEGDLQFWATLRAGKVESSHVVANLREVEVAAAPTPGEAATPALHLAQVGGVARWRRSDGGWQLDVVDLHASRSLPATLGNSLKLGRTTRVDGSPAYSLHSEQMDVSTVALLAQLPGIASEAQRAWLVEAAPQGRVRSLHFDFADKQDFSLRAQLSELRIKPSHKMPGISGLDASVLGDGQAIVLQLPAQSTTVTASSLFREPFAFSRLAGDIAAFRGDDGWHVETDALDLAGEGFSLQLRGGAEIRDDGRSPLLDLYALIEQADVRATRLFLPLGHMSTRAMNWLDRALVAGSVTNGRAAIRADLGDWPLRNLAGRFSARAELVGLDLDYNPNWPRANGVSAVAEFVNTSLHVVANSGTVLGANTTLAVADIADFDEPVLGLHLEGGGSGAQMLAVVNASPLGKRNAQTLQGISIGGRATVKVDLTMPLNPGSKDTLDGEVQLSDSDLTAQKWNIDFKSANGPVRFNVDGFTAGPLELRNRDLPARLNLAVGADVADAAHEVEATLAGRMPVGDVFAGFETLLPLWQNLPGSSEWNISLAVPKSTGGVSPPTQLRFGSDLRGTAILLPAPLDKAEDAALPVQINLTLPLAGSPLTLAMGDLVRMHARLPDAQHGFAASIDFGAQMPAQPPETGIVLGGHARRIDLSGWAALGLGQGPGLLDRVDLLADVALLGGQEFQDIGVRLQNSAQQVDVEFVGAAIQGNLSLPLLNSDGVRAKMQRLYWPESTRPEGTDAPDALGTIAPAGIPALHFDIDDFRLGKTRFGRTRIETAPLPDGMRIDQFDSESADMRMQARGEWRGDGQSNRSEFSIGLGADNIGRMLGAFGYAGIFDGGVTKTELVAHWPGSPAAFALAKVDGTLKVEVGEGRVLDVEPGMGRLFGLFSVREIPRRLALDFGDFFRSGMSFNAIKGEFSLQSGNAYTEDLHIASPAADIHIHGRTGLGAKDYDQQMVVTPRVGGTLPIVGALAGGPAGAAAGLAVQAIFNKAINQVTTARYHVEGSWEKPVITLIAKEGSRRRPGAEPKPSPEQR